jgi:hypothetical protein
MNDLAALGDAIESAVRADLAPRHRIRRRLAVGALALAVLIPGAAIAAEQLLTNDDVAQSLPAGSLILAGTEPTCTTVTENVEYHCVLAHAPVGGREAGAVKGSVYQTVSKDHHVNGGCRALNDDATEWECYIGQAAVDQKIIGQGFLGEIEMTPGVG